MLDERIEQFKDLSVSELSNRATLTTIADLAQEYIDGMCTGDAKELLLVFEESLNKKSSQLPSESREYLNRIYFIAAWGAFPLVSDDTAEILFKTQLLLALHLTVDINLITRAIGYFQLVRGNSVLIDKHRNLLLGALKNNSEMLGTKQLTLEGENNTVSPTIASWIRDYDLTVSIEKRQSPVGILEYVNASTNIRALNEMERSMLRIILELYDFVRFLVAPQEIADTGHTIERDKKSLSPTEEIKEPTGVISPSIAPMPVSSGVDSITAAYQGDPKLATAITKEESRLGSQSSAQLNAKFYEAVQNKNNALVIALFRTLAQKDGLLTFLSEDQRLKGFLSATWEKQYGKPLADEFTANPTQVKFVRLFIRYILEDRLGMSRTDAARIGLQIGNIFVNQGKKEYNKMAYFDVKTQAFEWFEN